MSKFLRYALFALLCLIILGLAAAVFGTAYIRNIRQSEIGPGNPAVNLTPAERTFLQLYLYQNRALLNQAPGSNRSEMTFTVHPGESANIIAQRLQAIGILDNPTLFLRYLQYNGMDNELEAGDFILSPDLTLTSLAHTLTNATAQEVVLTFLEGWRIEEMARYLESTRPAEIDPERFLSLARREIEPTTFSLNSYSFLNNLPDYATLEGYLFPDTYRLPLDTTADQLIDTMLSNFDQRLSPDLRQAFGTNQLTIRQAVILASIIEREAVLDFEKPMMASVFYNRIDNGMGFEADPTVQYAVGYYAERDSWWKVPLTTADLQINSYYNTYLYSGFPPGPISAPGIASLEAVARPHESDNLFFVVDCESEQPYVHAFNVTYEAHLEKVVSCR